MTREKFPSHLIVVVRTAALDFQQFILSFLRDFSNNKRVSAADVISWDFPHSEDGYTSSEDDILDWEHFVSSW